MNDLKTDNWYYVQLFTVPYDGEHTTICFASNTTEAEQKVREWFNGTIDKIHLYHKNYKREAKSMVASGNFI